MDKKHEILNAAFDIFSEKGYHLSVAELAKAVNIKTPSLYSHFESKDEIIELVVRDEIERYYSFLKGKMLEVSSFSCKEAMKSLYGSVIDYFSKDKRLRFWRAVPFIQNQQLKSISTQLIVDNDRNFKQQMEQCFSKGQSNGEIRPDVSPGALRLYLCMIQGVLDGMLLYPKELVNISDADELFEAYWDGICVTDSDHHVPQNQRRAQKHHLKRRD